MNVDLHWDGNDLYVGRVYIGAIMRMVPEGWRELDSYKLPPKVDEPEFVKINRENARKSHERHDAKPWRGWIMTCEDGSDVGYWATESEARNHTMALASDLLSA